MTAWERLMRIFRSQVSWGPDLDVDSIDFEPMDTDSPPRTARQSDQDPQLAQCYANLEIPYGSDLGTARKAWKTLLKKYHPDMHHQDPEKRRIANELSAEITRAFRRIEQSLSRKEM